MKDEWETSDSIRFCIDMHNETEDNIKDYYWNYKYENAHHSTSTHFYILTMTSAMMSAYFSD